MLSRMVHYIFRKRKVEISQEHVNMSNKTKTLSKKMSFGFFMVNQLFTYRFKVIVFIGTINILVLL